MTIENKVEVSKDLEKALQALEQAKQRVANEKKKQNEKKRKAEKHHKYISQLCGLYYAHFDFVKSTRKHETMVQLQLAANVIAKSRSQI